MSLKDADGYTSYQGPGGTGSGGGGEWIPGCLIALAIFGVFFFAASAMWVLS